MLTDNMEFVHPLPSGEAGRIRGNVRFLAGESIPYSLMVLAFLCIAGANFTRHGIDIAFLIGVFVFGSVGFLLHSINGELVGNTILKGIARRRVFARSDRIVEPSEESVWFVEEISKEQWQAPTWDRAADVGFLRVDHERGLLLFEGDRARYEIPAAAIIRCDNDFSKVYHEESGYGGAVVRQWLYYFFVVVTIRSQRRNYDAAFRILTGSGLFLKDQRAAATLALISEIEKLRKQSQ